MIEKIHYNPIAFKSYNSISNDVSNPIDNKPREFSSDFYVDKNGADAIKVRNFVANPTEINKPISYNNYVKQLQNANLVENKDYVLDEYDVGNGRKDYCVTIIRNGNDDKPYKIVSWNNGNEIENYNGYEDIFYPIGNNQPNTTYYSYDKENLLDSKVFRYENPKMHKELFPENIDINTTSEEYTKMLDSKNIKYDISKTSVEDNGIMTSIHEFDKNGYDEVKNITFFEYPNSSNKTIFYSDTPGIDGILTHHIDLVNDNDGYRLYITENEKYKGNSVKNTIKY